MSIKKQIENEIYNFSLTTDIPFSRREIEINYNGELVNYKDLITKSDYIKNILNNELNKYFISCEYNLLDENIKSKRKFHPRARVYYKRKELIILNRNLLKMPDYL